MNAKAPHIADSGPTKRPGELCRTPVEVFAIDYEMPQGLANCLIGPNELETLANIESMKDYLAFVVRKYNLYFIEKYGVVTSEQGVSDGSSW